MPDAVPAVSNGTSHRHAWGNAVVVYLAFFLLGCLQSPGKISPDTKLDLHVDPAGLLARATHLWDSQSFAGHVSNQAYGYLFPQGPFFALFARLGIPPWIVERLWWALVLTVAFYGVVQVATALRIATPGARVCGGLLYALAPRLLGDVTSISSESWVVALAPWVLLPIIHGLQGQMPARQAGAGAALAVALMGAVNAVATAMACLPAVLWFFLHRPGRTWWKVAAWWVPLSMVVSLWWAVPLLLLGRVSPPFLDHIESAAVTTRWASTTEVLRGATSWVPFVTTDRAGAELVSEPVFVLATAVLAATGLVGLLRSSMPARGRLLTIAAAGLVLMSAAWVGPAGGALAEPLRQFLDGAGAPLRNVHKAEPVLRLPLVLGAIHAIGLMWQRVLSAAAGGRSRWAALARPERDPVVALAMVVVVAAVVSWAPAWRLSMVSGEAFTAVPEYWHDAADWLATHASTPPPVGGSAESGPVTGGEVDPAATTRALIVPGASFGRQVWGLTRDEPIQPLAATPWTVRDAVPLQPAPAIRALDSVQKLLAEGRPAPGMAATLATLGIGYLVVRNDLAAESGAARPLLVHHALDNSPGVHREASFGPAIVGRELAMDEHTEVADYGLRPAYPAIEIYSVSAHLGAGAGAPSPPRTATAPYVVDLNSIPIVSGGPEVLSRLDTLATLDNTGDSPPRITRLLAADARAAGLDDTENSAVSELSSGVILTDTPVDREVDMGRLDHHSSAARAAGQATEGRGAVADYAASVGDPALPGSEPVPRAHLAWQGGRVTASSSASNVDQPGPVLPSHSVVAAVDGDLETWWRSAGLTGGIGQWIRIDLPQPRDRLTLDITVPDLTGAAVTGVQVRTNTGSSTVDLTPGTAVSVPLPPGASDSVWVTATRFADGSRGQFFPVADIGVRTGEKPIEITATLELPAVDPDTDVAGWLLGPELAGRVECVPDGPKVTGLAGGAEHSGAVRCAPQLGIVAEEPGIVRRQLHVPNQTSVVPELVVRPRPGDGLNELLRGSAPERSRTVSADADSSITDSRGNAAAAVDGDRSTSWYAQSGDPSPSIELGLPRRHLISALRVWPSRTTIPATPRILTVDTGVQRTRINLDTIPTEHDGSRLVELPADYSDTVTVRIDDAEPVLSDGAPVPTGLAEVWVLGATGDRIGALPAASTSEITVACEDGPTVTIDGTEAHFRLDTTRDQLLSGRPIFASRCEPARNSTDKTGQSDTADNTSLALDTGAVAVDPGPAFSVDTLALTVDDTATQAGGTGNAGDPDGSDNSDNAASLGGALQRAQGVPVGQWSNWHRSIAVAPSLRAQVVVVPESVSAAWSASLVGSDGTETVATQPLTVDGWKQAWIIPPLAEPATLELHVPLDRPYRLALATGIPALLTVLVALLLPGPRRAGARAQPWQIPGYFGGTVALGVAWLLGAATAVALTIGVAGLALVVSRYRGPTAARAALVVGAASGVLAGAALLSRAPWPDPSGYAGDTVGPQLATLAGLACAAVAAVWPGARPDSRRDQERSSARRAGSSTSE